MNKILVSSLALIVLTGGALAQATAPAPANPPPAPMGLKAPPPPPPGGPDALDDGGPGAPPREARGKRPPPPPSRAAHFRVESGDLALDVKCADDEPMKACADLTLQMLDKLQAMPKP